MYETNSISLNGLSSFNSESLGLNSETNSSNVEQPTTESILEMSSFVCGMKFIVYSLLCPTSSSYCSLESKESICSGLFGFIFTIHPSS